MVLGFRRGADREVRSWSEANPTPGPGQEWLVVELRVMCAEQPPRKCFSSPAYFRLIAQSGKVYAMASTWSVPQSIRGDMPGQTETTGQLIFLVDKADTGFILTAGIGSGQRIMAVH
jgi:hypothetical protein